MKRISFLGDSLISIKSFPLPVKREVGYQLDRVQRSKNPIDWKPMPVVGAGVKEIRTQGRDGIYRVLFVAKYHGLVYVLHAFQKKSQKTSKQDLEKAMRMFKLIQERANGEPK